MSGYDLDGKIVLITGGGSGIGLATVRAFVEKGAQVVVADRDPAAAAVEAQRPVHTTSLDTTAEGALQAWVDGAAATFGGVDVLVNNVGVAPFRDSFLNVSDDQWKSLLEVNFFSAVRASRAAIPYMIERGGGAIVSLASDAATQPDPFFVDYAVSKSAVLSLSKSISMEFGPQGIRANCVAPGPTATPAMDGFLESLSKDLGKSFEEAKEYFAKDMRKLPLGRMNDPADVAAVIVFLASGLARQVTGASYRVDAGSHIYL
ncbi:SDR family NAD(P)-dependent oxidoreductase [Salinicola peritrichatus]|uniref:SDR family NAD(P)-dependent oxidoreductase n=1 Tax=Salinicola peritrichatus TaxID=1267424 RepID=UPI000DA1FBB8|nr:SDR family oxidoreductase [Salinicola peritrichatus]